MRLIDRLSGLAGGGSTAALRRQNADLRRELAIFNRGWPPGHFYSPIPDLEAIEARRAEIWPEPPPAVLPGVDLRADGQLALLGEIAAGHDRQPWSDAAGPQRRFHFDNDNFRHGEALALLGMMLRFSPKRIVEIGSGYSSCAMLDADELFFGGALKLTFIEPYPDLLLSLIRPEDRDRVAVVDAGAQSVGPQAFAGLEPGDFVFIDSTHVSKVDSDVNHILFTLLPSLPAGVIVHFHDIYYPFEYPRDWVMQGRAWNEAYALRAFLQYNAAFEMLLFNHYLGQLHAEAWDAALPLAAGRPGSSLWLRKTA